MAQFKNKLSALITQQLPEYMRTDLSTFAGSGQTKIVDFLEAYYEWLEREENVYGRTFDIQNLLDIDDTIDSFVEYFHKEFMNNIPRDVLADKRKLIKHIRAFYQAKGSEKSFKLLFRILYAKDVDILYPQYIEASSGKWMMDRTLRVTPGEGFTDASFANIDGKLVIGDVSNATATVDDVVQYTSYDTLNSYTVSEIRLLPKSIVGDFRILENVVAYSGNSSTTVIARGKVHPIISGFVVDDRPLSFYSSNTISDLGSMTFDTFRLHGGVDNRIGDLLTANASSNFGFGGSGKVIETTLGPITQLTMTARGTNYVSRNATNAFALITLGDGTGTYTIQENVIQDNANLGAVAAWNATSKVLTINDIKVDDLKSNIHATANANIVGTASSANFEISKYVITKGKVSDRIQIVNDYLVLDRVNSNFRVGETITSTISNATAQVRFWDAQKNYLWIKNLSEPLITSESTPWSTQKDIVVGGTTTATGSVFQHKNSSGSGFEGYVKKSNNETGAVETFEIINQGSGYEFIPYAEIIASGTGTGANVVAYGEDIGRIKKISVWPQRFGTASGFGWGYVTDPFIDFGEQFYFYSKPLKEFLDNSIGEVVMTSNAAIITHTNINDGTYIFPSPKISSNATFANTIISYLDRTNVTARGSATLSAMAEYDGNLSSTKGLLNIDDQRIHDGYYYQKLSYVIKVSKEMDAWKDIVKKLLHPSGMALFGENPSVEVIQKGEKSTATYSTIS